MSYIEQQAGEDKRVKDQDTATKKVTEQGLII
jgi:hypothetical protein